MCFYLTAITALKIGLDTEFHVPLGLLHKAHMDTVDDCTAVNL